MCIVSKEENCNYCCSVSITCVCFDQREAGQPTSQPAIHTNASLLDRWTCSPEVSLCFSSSRPSLKCSSAAQALESGIFTMYAYFTRMHKYFGQSNRALDITASFMLLVARCLSFVCCPGNNKTPPPTPAATTTIRKHNQYDMAMAMVYCIYSGRAQPNDTHIFQLDYI